MNFATRFNAISWVLLAFLLLNLNLIDTMLLFAVFVMFTDAVAGFPGPLIVVAGVIAWTVSAPGIAAAFAAYRDAHAMRFGESDAARAARLRKVSHVTAIADPYWSEAEDTRIVRPYFRAYVRLFRRTLAVAAVFGGVLAVALAAALLALRLPSPLGTFIPALLFGFAAYTVLASLVGYSMVVEFPRAQRTAIVRNSFTLAARSWRPAALGLALLAVYGYALLRWPYLMLIFGTSLAFFFLYHVAETIIRPVRALMIEEEPRPADWPNDQPGDWPEEPVRD